MSASSEAASGLGTPIKGPSALGTDWRRFWHLTWTLAVTEWRLRFFGSALGYAWSVFRPLLLFGVLYAVFSTFLDLGDVVPYYPSALLLGIVLFSFFSESTKGCVTALVAREPIVRKIEFPIAAVPVSVVLTALFNLGLNLLPVFAFFLIDGGTFHWTWIELVPLIALLAVLALAVGMLLSALFVRYRDIEPIWDVSLQVMFYAAPIFYPIELVLREVADDWAHLMLVNPFAAILQQARHAVMGPEHLSLEQAIGGWANVMEPVIVGAVLVALGTWVFARRAPRLAEEL